MKRMKRSAFVTQVGSIAVATGIAAPALSQTLETVNVGSVNSVSDGPFLIADQKGYFRDVGIKVNFINFNSAALMVPSIGTGQIDLGGGAPSAGLYNAISRGIAIKIVADRGSDPPGYGFSDLLVRNTRGQFLFMDKHFSKPQLAEAWLYFGVTFPKFVWDYSRILHQWKVPLYIFWGIGGYLRIKFREYARV